MWMSRLGFLWALKEVVSGMADEPKQLPKFLVEIADVAKPLV